MINLSPSGLKMMNIEFRYGSNNLYQISSKDIRIGFSNIKIKFVPFIYCPWEKRILECISPARISCNISCIQECYK